MTVETKQAHSPEPWADDRGGDLRDGEGRLIAFSYDIEGANRDRIRACVNALAGIPTEALESGALAKALEVSARIAELHAAAVRNLHPYEDCGTCQLVAAMRALGALGKGGRP
jgi:hypothetical protein